MVALRVWQFALWALAVIMLIRAFVPGRDTASPAGGSPESPSPGGRQARYIVSAVAFALAGFLALAWQKSLVYDAGNVYAAAVNAADDLEARSGDGLQEPTSWDVYRALEDNSRSGALKIEERGKDASGGDRYEITNEDGEYPVCLTVTSDSELRLGDEDPWRTSVTATVDDGRC